MTRGTESQVRTRGCGGSDEGIGRTETSMNLLRVSAPECSIVRTC